VTESIDARTVARLDQGGRVLLSRLQYLGDVILSLPAARALRDRFPRAPIDYLARGPAADVLAGEAIFDRVVRMPARGEGYRSTWRMLRRLRERQYAVAIDLYANPRSALTMKLSGAPMRIGGSRRGRRVLYTHPVWVPPTVRSAALFHMAHLKPLGIDAPASKPSLTISQAEREHAVRHLARCGVRPGAPVVGIHPGGKWEVKRWPAEYFAALAERLIERGIQVVVLCGPGEEAYRDVVRDRLGQRAAYLPVLPIRQTAAVIHALDAIAVCDGGIMHVAVAVDTPTVGIFGSSEPEVWFPYEMYGPYTAAYVPITCRPCHSHLCSHISCLRKLTVDMVEEKLHRVMEAESAAARLARGR
jgi:lipopolysaccharide heptosyltransferase II